MDIFCVTNFFRVRDIFPLFHMCNTMFPFPLTLRKKHPKIFYAMSFSRVRAIFLFFFIVADTNFPKIISISFFTLVITNTSYVPTTSKHFSSSCIIYNSSHLLTLIFTLDAIDSHLFACDRFLSIFSQLKRHICMSPVPLNMWRHVYLGTS